MTSEPLSPSATFLTVRGAAQYSTLSSAAIRRLIRNQRLKAYRVGQRVVIEREDVDRLIRGEAQPK
jgi:excisionase family DNA binding protein